MSACCGSRVLCTWTALDDWLPQSMLAGNSMHCAVIGLLHAVAASVPAADSSEPGHGMKEPNSAKDSTCMHVAAALLTCCLSCPRCCCCLCCCSAAYAAEEYALHKVIGRARAYWDDDFLPPAESLALLPCRDVDGDFLALTEYAFDDHDATPSTVLWDHPELINASELHEYMGTAKLHPEDWFWAFKDQRAHDHVL